MVKGVISLLYQRLKSQFWWTSDSQSDKADDIAQWDSLWILNNLDFDVSFSCISVFSFSYTQPAFVANRTVLCNYKWKERNNKIKEQCMAPFTLPHSPCKFLQLFTLSIGIFNLIQLLEAISEHR